jgi:hypothetical protein
LFPHRGPPLRSAAEPSVLRFGRLIENCPTNSQVANGLHGRTDLLHTFSPVSALTKLVLTSETKELNQSGHGDICLLSGVCFRLCRFSVGIFIDNNQLTASDGLPRTVSPPRAGPSRRFWCLGGGSDRGRWSKIKSSSTAYRQKSCLADTKGRRGTLEFRLSRRTCVPS